MSLLDLESKYDLKTIDYLPICGRSAGRDTIRRMGRPPKDKAGGSVSGPGSMHLGLRLGPHRAEQLKRLVDHANDVAEKNGLPAAFTASALVVAQMNDWLDAECAKLDRRKR